jgi:hypothetical protein
VNETARLADELMRFFRLGARAKGMLNNGDLGAEFSALMLLFPLRFCGPMRVTDLAEDGLAACRKLHDAREAFLAEVLSSWPADRVEAFVELFIEFNTAVEARLRIPSAPPQRENA